MNKKLILARVLMVWLCIGVAPALFGQGGGGGGGRGGGGGGGGGRGGGGGGGAGGFGGGGAGQGTSASAGYAPNGQIGSITFTIDQASGSIIYTTDDTNNANVMRALQGLDRPKQQALIKVVFLEVQLNKGRDVGVEGSLIHKINTPDTIGTSNLFGLATQGATPTSGITTLTGASFFGIQGNDFNAIVRAIEEVGTVKILSRPTVVAQHAQPAQVVVGQEVPLITGVNFGTLGQVTSVITYTSVGIILNVTPFIHPNGDVEMILNPEITEVANQSTIVSTGTNGTFSTPYLNERSANTVVTVPSGQTVILGGMMQDSRTVTDSHVPILGSIPVLGNLFKHKVSSDQKTELMIFVTPTVISGAEDWAKSSVDEHSRVPDFRKAFPKKELDEYIDPVSPNQENSSAPNMSMPKK